MYEAEPMADEATERKPASVPPAETPGLTGLLTLAVGVVVVAGLYLGRTVLIPITLAVLLSLSPRPPPPPPRSWLFLFLSCGGAVLPPPAGPPPRGARAVGAAGGGA